MIGILALQGGFDAHRKVLDQLGIPCRLVKLAKHLDGLKGLILPGGESSTMLKLMECYDLFDSLDRFGREGLPILGTCAGAILMCEKVDNVGQKSFGWVPVHVERNAYGSQRESFQIEQECPLWSLSAVPSLFIRAPRITNPGRELRVLSRYGKDVTGVVYQHYTAITYHPELGGETRFHERWYQRSGAHEMKGYQS